MRKGIKGMAALLCACMMLEMACGSVFAKQTEGDKAASTLEEAAPEVTAESDASTDAAETEAAEEQEAPAEEPESSPAGEAEDDTEIDGDTELESTPENEDVTEQEDTQKNEGPSDTETGDASKSEDVPESDNAMESDGTGTLETEDTKEMNKTPEDHASEPDDVPRIEDTWNEENKGRGDTAETEETFISPNEGSDKNDELGVVLIEEPADYYVVISEDHTKLTFQTEKPGLPSVGGKDYWTGDNDFVFPKNHTEAWHLYKHEITSVEFSNVKNITLNGAVFYDFTNLKSVTCTNKEGGISLGRNSEDMFHKCTSLTTLDLSGWDTSQVTNMLDMFAHCSSLETLDLSGWDTSSVMQMGGMFEGCHKLKELDLSDWDTTNVRHMNNMFAGCNSLNTITVGDNFVFKGNVTPVPNSNGYWAKTNDRTSPMEDNDTFLSYFDNAGKGGTYIWGHKLTYNPNGGIGEVPKPKVYRGEEGVNLDKGESLKKEKATFIGWTVKYRSGTVKTKEEESNAGLHNGHIKAHNSDETYYAAWAVDENENGIPDYDEDKVTITFDINGGDGSKEAAPHNDTYKVSDKLPGTSLIMSIYATLKWEKAWIKDGSPATHPAILAGWSESKETAKDIILENDMDEGGAGLSKKLINRSQAKAPEQPTTYYAVYAEDENGDHIVDYLENSVQVEYYANGGTRTDGKWVDKEKGIFYRCSHHHVHNEDGVVLMELEQGKAYVSRDGAVLLGWSEKQVENLVASDSQEKDAGLITTVKMPAEGNKKVYAVWAEDRNKNGQADYTETKVKLTFDINHGDGSGDKSHTTTYSVERLPGTPFDMPTYADLHWNEKWEKDGQPAEFAAILAGWSDHAVNGVILEDDINDQAAVHAHLSDQMIKQPHITVPTTNTTYYAVYAADENHDDEPDYLEYAEQVDYYANGGTMVSGSWLDGIDGLFYKCGHHHVKGEKVTLLRLERGKEMITRDSAVLLGWSAKAVELVTSAEVEANAGIITEYTMPEGDGKVYAVWAEDTNGNGTPDYEENIEPPKDESQEEKPPVEKPDHPYWSFYTGVYGASSVQNASAGWVQDANGWKYYYANGTYAASKWELIKGKWYYFKPNGYMMTGWQLIGGVWYHLDDSDGDMDTGWYFDQSDGRWYYLDTSGAMLTGWQMVSEKYYYLHEGTMAETGRPFGSMYANETTPDGYTVDASGAWVQ